MPIVFTTDSSYSSFLSPCFVYLLFSDAVRLCFAPVGLLSRLSIFVCLTVVVCMAMLCLSVITHFWCILVFWSWLSFSLSLLLNGRMRRYTLMCSFLGFGLYPLPTASSSAESDGAIF